MRKDEREKFLQWFEENKNNKFDFLKEIEKYCVNDVDILMKSVMIFKISGKKKFWH